MGESPFYKFRTMCFAECLPQDALAFCVFAQQETERDMRRALRRIIPEYERRCLQ